MAITATKIKSNPELITFYYQNGKHFPIFKNPSNDEYFIICDRFDNEYPFYPKGEPKTRTTFDQEGNKYLWMSGDSMHFQVENFLKEKFNCTCDQNAFY